MKKISNEFKIGFLGIAAIVLLIFGISFLRNDSLFEKPKLIYSLFQYVGGLNKGTPVYANGLVIGQIENIQPTSLNFSHFIVTLSLNKEIYIPINSTVLVKEVLIGDNVLYVELGNSPEYIKNGDTIKMKESLNLIKSLGTVQQKADSLMQLVFLTINNANSFLSSNNVNNIKLAIQNIATITEHVKRFTTIANNMATREQESVHNLINNMENISEIFINNKKKIESILNNLNNVSKNLNTIDIQNNMMKLEKILNQLALAVSAIDTTGKGNIAKLLHDSLLYKQLNHNLYSLNTLLDDIRIHPKRYFQVSVFGNNKYNKLKPLEKPINDSTKK